MKDYDKLAELKKYRESKSFEQLVEKYRNIGENIRDKQLTLLLNEPEWPAIKHSEAKKLAERLKVLTKIRDDIEDESKWGQMLKNLYTYLIDWAKETLACSVMTNFGRSMSEPIYSDREIELTKAWEFCIIGNRLDGMIWVEEKEKEQPVEDVYE